MISRLKQLFRKKNTAPDHQLQTKPLRQKQTGELSNPSLEHTLSALEPPQLVTGCGQSVGIQREHNEDALFTLTTSLVSDTRHIPFGLFIIADGMGGHQNGEVASALAVRAMAAHVIRKIYLTLFSTSQSSPDDSLQDLMKHGILEAHNAIVKQVIGGGTTLTAVLIFGDQMVMAHVGDSRAYSISMDGTMVCLTRDHSIVRRLEELGQLTTEEAAVHPQRNVLYLALGQGEPLEPDIISMPVPKPGYLMLCSDGLWGVVEQKKLVSLIAASPSPDQACLQMVEAANQAGGPDNISVVLVKISE